MTQRATPPPDIFESSAPRFTRLLLEDDEYFFSDVNCHLHHAKPQPKTPGQLKICSFNLYWVPRDSRKPIIRISYKTTPISPSVAVPPSHNHHHQNTTNHHHSMNCITLTSTKVTEMQLRDQPAPYTQVDNPPPFYFSLVFARAVDVLEEVQLLWSLATQNNSNNSSHIDRAAAAAIRKELIDKKEAGWNSALFCPGWLEDSETLILESPVSRITPLCEQPGRVGLTEKRVILQPHGRRISESQILVKNIADVKHIADRRYALQNTAVELFFKSCDYKESLFLNFKTQGDRDAFKECLCKQDIARKMVKRKKYSLKNWTRDWQVGKISNFQYLMHLNLEAGRSFQDLSQYPVFPWIIQDYTSSTLDLDDPSVFRDLSKPIGALNAERLKRFRERYTELSRLSMYLGDDDGGIPPPFMYGCHFSSPGYVVFYLMRSSPQLMLKLQNGKFDAADRLFWSLEDAWRSVSTSSTDVKELIPEFYHGNGDFLKNTFSTTSIPNFGCRANGTPVSDVDLPPWAMDASDFVTKLSAALESKYISSRLHQWIDLVFGVKSRGEKAVQADNVFHYLTYDEIALEQLSKAKDPMLKEALRVQMMEFGRTPRQLFLKKHPKKRAERGGRWGLISSCVLSCVAPSPPLQFSTSAATGAAGVAVKVEPLDKEEEVAMEEEEGSITASGSFYSVEEIASMNGLTPSPQKWNGSPSVTPRTVVSDESNVRLSSHPIEENSEEEER